jgi:hypothetical protein
MLPLKTYINKCELRHPDHHLLTDWHVVLPRDGDTYRGRWHYDDSKQRWLGNPVDSAEVETVMDVIKNKFGAEGERHHSKAMSKEDMDRLLLQSRLDCPADMPVTDHASLMLKATHLRFNAFSTTGFNIWTRCVGP